MVSSDMSEVNIYSEKYLSFTYFNHFLRTSHRVSSPYAFTLYSDDKMSLW